MAFWLRWPVDSSRITQVFGARPGYYSQFGLKGHEGLDFAAPTGSRIYACAAGTVDMVSAAGAYGLHVRIAHAGGWKTAYAHLQTAFVAAGDRIGAGHVIGLADNTGNSNGAHLHLTLYAPPGQGTPGYPNNIANPSALLEPYPRDAHLDCSLAGLHDGAAWLLDKRLPAWDVEPIYLDDLRPRSLDYAAHEQAGIRVIVRLSCSYARADGGAGTYPPRERYAEFIEACVDTIRASRGVWGWTLGNETNSSREWPARSCPRPPRDFRPPAAYSQRASPVPESTITLRRLLRVALVAKRLQVLLVICATPAAGDDVVHVSGRCAARYAVGMVGQVGVPDDAPGCAVAAL